MMDFQKESDAFIKTLREEFPLTVSSLEIQGIDLFQHFDNEWVIWQAAKSQAVPEGFVLVPHDQFESLSMFKDLYKRAIISARKRKDQLNWAHVAGLGVGSGRAVELCKMLNIDPYATNMHEVIEAQEQSHE